MRLPHDLTLAQNSICLKCASPKILWFLLVDLAITVGIIYWFFYRGPA
jgi:hypothetical protein